jgi:hypothetical protein
VRSIALVSLLGLVAACSKGDSATPPEKTAEQTRKLAGVYAENFKCDSVTSLEALGQTLGGKVSVIDSPMSTPRGVPHPCNYAVQAETGAEYWTYDIDCRDGMKQRADALFAQYRDDSSAMVHQYNTLADAGAIKPTDAGTVIHAPGDAVEVAVGAKGLDHHGQGLIFIDDDAPCYVRVVGPDSARRLELAKLVAKNLTFVNAPMTPRPMP